MNRKVIEKLGQFLPPGQENGKGNSLAVNLFGGRWAGLFVLCEDGHVRFMALDEDHEGEESDEGESKVLQMEGIESLMDMNFSSIDFNFSGSILMLWGNNSVATAFLPTNSSEVDTCDFLMLYQASHSKDEVVKAIWHPLSDRHIVLLLRTNKLLLFDTVARKESEYLLDVSKTYISFCFGPCIDWLQLSIFLLDSQGDITCMCPVLPTGAVVPLETIHDLKDWLADTCLDDMDTRYLEAVDMYLRAAFGKMASGDDKNQLKRAGVCNGKPLAPDNEFFNAFYRQPLLQGPFVVEGRMKIRKRGNAAIPCDICMPRSKDREDAIPLILVSWNDGVVEQLVVGDVFGPSWGCFSDDQDDGNEVYRFSLPKLVHLETICIEDIGSSNSTKSNLTLASDPDNFSRCYVTSRQSGLCYMICLNWFEGYFENSQLAESTARLIFKHESSNSGIGVSGQVVIVDPAFGHICIVRGGDGFLSAINLSIEEKLVSMEFQFEEEDRQAMTQTSLDNSRLTSITRSADSILYNVNKALRNIPMENYSDDEASAVKFGEVLKKCILYLGKEVIDPLEEFEFGMKFAKDCLREIHRSQSIALVGSTASSKIDSLSSASLTATSDKGDGLLRRYEAAQSRHLELKKRLEAVGKRIQQQKQVSASSLHFCKRKCVQLTRAEELYKVQIERWQVVYQHLEVSLQRIRDQIENPSKDLRTSGELAGHRSSRRSSPKKSFMTPTKPRSTLSHIASPHRISFQDSPGGKGRVRNTSSSEASPAPSISRITLDSDEMNSCNELQKETGILQEALKKQIEEMQGRISRISTTFS